jgi:hypothetical protein
VILALPERPETQPFWQLVAERGLVWRALKRVARPDLATPISIYELADIRRAPDAVRLRL